MKSTKVIPCLLLLLPLCGGVSCAQPVPDWEAALATDGLAAAERSLAARDETPETAFLLGSVQFLQAFEAIFQVRYRSFGNAVPAVPGMLNELPDNPDAAFDPKFVETAMTRALAHLARAESTLELAVDGEFGARANLRDFWFDVDADGERDAWEGLVDLMAELNSRPDIAAFDGAVRFDTADAEWLKAYVHVASGMAELVLSLDPTPTIRQVYEGRLLLDELSAMNALPLFGDPQGIDIAAGVLLTLQGVPDRARTRAAHDHFRSAIAHNLAFWKEVGHETDNDGEWLPNANQTSAFGVDVTVEAAAAWQDVLSEIGAVLEGERLIRYWQAGMPESGDVGVGVNVAKLLRDPGDMDVLLWIQGAGAAPYLERGRLASMSTWRQFLNSVPGNGTLFAIWFN